MHEDIQGTPAQSEFMRVADLANEKFVELAGYVFRLVTLKKPDGTEEGRQSDHGAETAVAERVQQPRRGAARGREASSEVTPKEVELKVRELFLSDPQSRFAATRWLGRHGCTQVIPTLEGVLRIEEDGMVRREMVQCLEVLRKKNVAAEDGR